jgi:hypothetical protein
MKQLIQGLSPLWLEREAEKRRKEEAGQQSQRTGGKSNKSLGKLAPTEEKSNPEAPIGDQDLRGCETSTGCKVDRIAHSGGASSLGVQATVTSGANRCPSTIAVYRPSFSLTLHPF